MTIVGIHGLSGSGKSTVAKWFAEEHGFWERNLADAMKEFVQKVYPDCARHPEYLFGPAELRKSLISTKLVSGAPFLVTNLVADLLPESRPKPGDVDGPKAFDRAVSAGRDLMDMLKEFEQRGLVPVREILQKIGTEWGRTIDPDIWARNLRREVNAQFPIIPEGWKGKEWGRCPFVDDCRVAVGDLRFSNEVDALRAISRPCTLLKIRREKRGEVEGGVPNHVSEQGLADELFDYVIDAPEGLFKLRRLLSFIWENEKRKLQGPRGPGRLGGDE